MPADHFFTTSDTGRDSLLAAQLGYVTEGEACYAISSPGQGGTALHRLFNAQSGEHFYTISDGERDSAISNLGYINEGEACFVNASAGQGQCPSIV